MKVVDGAVVVDFRSADICFEDELVMDGSMDGVR